MVWEVSGTGAVGFFGAEAQYEKYKGVRRDLKAVDPRFKMIALITDNENAMKAVRKKVRDDGDDSGGCGSHAMNKAMGMFTF